MGVRHRRRGRRPDAASRRVGAGGRRGMRQTSIRPDRGRGGSAPWMIALAASAAVVVAIAFPFTYVPSRMSRRAQTLILVLILCVLSLSEVIIGFAWSTLLSQTAGVGNLFRVDRSDGRVASLHAESDGADPRTGLSRITLPGADHLSGGVAARPRAARDGPDVRRVAPQVCLDGRSSSPARTSGHPASRRFETPLRRLPEPRSIISACIVRLCLQSFKLRGATPSR